MHLPSLRLLPPLPYCFSIDSTDRRGVSRWWAPTGKRHRMTYYMAAVFLADFFFFAVFFFAFLATALAALRFLATNITSFLSRILHDPIRLSKEFWKREHKIDPVDMPARPRGGVPECGIATVDAVVRTRVTPWHSRIRREAKSKVAPISAPRALIVAQ